MKLSVVIPAHNESGNIGPTLDHLRRRLSREGIPYEIIVVDDGSTDGTRSEVEERAAVDRDVLLVRNHGMPGFGRAVQCGLENFSGDAVVIAMADGSVLPSRADFETPSGW